MQPKPHHHPAINSHILAIRKQPGMLALTYKSRSADKKYTDRIKNLYFRQPCHTYHQHYPCHHDLLNLDHDFHPYHYENTYHQGSSCHHENFNFRSSSSYVYASYPSLSKNYTPIPPDHSHLVVNFESEQLVRKVSSYRS